MGGDQSRALNAVTTVITGALGGQTDLQVVANTLAPYAAQQIGDKFGHGEDKNTAAQLVSHAILGAALAYVNGGNPAAGGSAAVASEAAASYLAEHYNDGQTAINPQTGQFDPNLLPESIKSSIRDLTSAIGAVVGGTVGDSAFNAQLAGVVGQNAVENNIDSPGDRKDAKANANHLYKSACASAGLAAGSAACGAYIRKTTSDGLGNLSNGATVAGLYPTPASPYLLGAGSALGISSTFLDDSKNGKQKVAEIALSTIASKGADKLFQNVEKSLKNEVKIPSVVKNIYAEYAGKTAETIPGAIKECKTDSKQIGCTK